MTQSIEGRVVGVDVSKHTLDVYVSATDQTDSIANEPEAIESWLDSQSGPIRLAIEPTNTCHLGLATAAYLRGHRDFMIARALGNVSKPACKTRNCWLVICSAKGKSCVCGPL